MKFNDLRKRHPEHCDGVLSLGHIEVAKEIAAWRTDAAKLGLSATELNGWNRHLNTTMRNWRVAGPKSLKRLAPVLRLGTTSGVSGVARFLSKRFAACIKISGYEGTEVEMRIDRTGEAA